MGRAEMAAAMAAMARACVLVACLVWMEVSAAPLQDPTAAFYHTQVLLGEAGDDTVTHAGHGGGAKHTHGKQGGAKKDMQLDSQGLPKAQEKSKHGVKLDAEAQEWSKNAEKHEEAAKNLEAKLGKKPKKKEEEVVPAAKFPDIPIPKHRKGKLAPHFGKRDHRLGKHGQAYAGSSQRVRKTVKRAKWDQMPTGKVGKMPKMPKVVKKKKNHLEIEQKKALKATNDIRKNMAKSKRRHAETHALESERRGTKTESKAAIRSHGKNFENQEQHNFRLDAKRAGKKVKKKLDKQKDPKQAAAPSLLDQRVIDNYRIKIDKKSHALKMKKIHKRKKDDRELALNDMSEVVGRFHTPKKAGAHCSKCHRRCKTSACKSWCQMRWCEEAGKKAPIDHKKQMLSQKGKGAEPNNDAKKRECSSCKIANGVNGAWCRRNC